MKTNPIIHYLTAIVFMLIAATPNIAQIGENPPPPPPPAPNMEQEEIFKVVEQMPRFPGCEMLRASEEVVKKCAKEKMFEYIGKNLVYPQVAKDAKIEGTAVVTFVVGKTGQLRDIKIVRDVDGHFAKSVTNLIQGMPTWIPGKQRGQERDVMMTLPVKFKLDQDGEGSNKGKPGNGTMGMKGKANKKNTSNKMGKGKKMGKVSPFGKPKKVKKGDIQNSDTPPPPPPAPNEEESESFKVVEEIPRFPGCEKMNGTNAEKKKCADELMLQYIYKNIKYPSIARENDVEGTAVIQFVVDKDGSINDAEIIRDPGAGIGKESLRVVESMNTMNEKWTPGTQGGKKVKVLYTIPVKFKLEGKSTTKKKWWQFWK